MQPYTVEKSPTQIFGSSSPLTFVLNPATGKKVSKLDVVLEGQFTVTGVTTPGVVFAEGGPANLVEKIKVRLNPAPGSRYPGGHCVNLTPRGVIRLATIRIKKLVGEQSGSTIGNGANGVYSIYIAYSIYFCNPRGKNFATALNLDPFAYSSVAVKVYTGNLANCFTGNNGTITVNTLAVKVNTLAHNVPGDSFVKFMEDHVTQIPASKTDWVDSAMPSSGFFTKWLLLTEEGANATLTDGILNRAHIYGQGMEYDLDAQDVRDKMIKEGWVDASTNATGMYLFDFIDGDLSRAVPAAGVHARFDINMLSTSYVDGMHFITERVFPPRSMNTTQMPEYAS
jgi:hypothetical protein